MENKEKITFEDKLARLEEIVTQVEGSKKPLDELITLFKEGVSLSKECKAELERLDVEVRIVLEETSTGDLITEDLEKDI